MSERQSSDLRGVHFNHNLAGVDAWQPPIALDPNYHHLLNDAHLLHLLATNPSRVLPPGKSLASIFSDASYSEPDVNNVNPLEGQISNMVKRAFWEEATSSLASDNLGIIMNRLRLLYKDLFAALHPVLPPTNVVMITLSDPLSPTSSPLRSALNHLRSILSELRLRCAPTRDAEIDSLIQNTFAGNTDEQLPGIVTNTIRSILQVIEEMASDFHHFALANLNDQEMHDLIESEAMRREKDLVMRLYGGITGVKRAWSEWLRHAPSGGGGQAETSFRSRIWVSHLVQKLGVPISISIDEPPLTPLPPEPGAVTPGPQPSNTLPPPFLLSSPMLFRVQNLLQALVVCASLRLVLPRDFRQNGAPGSFDYDESEFTSRIWILLKEEVERGGHVEADTKLVNLEDEVVQAYRARTPGASDSNEKGSPIELGQEPSAKEETRLRESVRRIVRTEDPVFKLLMGRVVSAVGSVVTLGRPAATSVAPLHLRTGRKAPINQRQTDQAATLALPKVPGIDEPILVSALEEIAKEVDVVVQWVVTVWDDVVHDGG